MQKIFLTYLISFTLAICFVTSAVAAVTDPIVNAMDMAKYSIEQVGTIQENITSQFQFFMNDKIGKIGDINAVAKKLRKAEKIQQRIERLQKKAAAAKEKIAKLQERAQKIQQQVSEAKAVANQIIADAKAAKEAIEAKVEDVKQTVSDIKEAGQAIKDKATTTISNVKNTGAAIKEQVSNIKDKANDISEKVGIKKENVAEQSITPISQVQTAEIIGQTATQTSIPETISKIPSTTQMESDISASEVWQNSIAYDPSTEEPVFSTTTSFEDQLTGQKSSININTLGDQNEQ